MDEVARRCGRRVAVWALCVLIAAASLCSAADTARQIYGKRLVAIDEETDAKARAWPGAYLAELVAVEGKLQAAGALDGVLAVRAERDRFMATRKIPEKSEAGLHSAIGTIREKYTTAGRRISVERATEIVKLTSQYLTYLKRMQVKLTKAGKIESAVLADKEIERVRSAPVYTAAEFLLADEAATAFGGGLCRTRAAP